jgi:hypothetical protein
MVSPIAATESPFLSGHGASSVQFAPDWAIASGATWMVRVPSDEAMGRRHDTKSMQASKSVVDDILGRKESVNAAVG